VEALKSAANIRNLKGEDSITLCVVGGPPSGTARVVAPPNSNSYGGFGGGGRSGPAPSSQGTILTMRAKKADVDAFARGRLTIDDFRKKVNMTAYLSDSDPAPALPRYGY
jgi:hypothetical protein